MKSYDLAVVIGRFQPLHIAHQDLIACAFQKATKVLVLAGSANESRTKKNPLTFEERRNIIEIVFSSNIDNLTVKPLYDYESDWDWLAAVDEEIDQLKEQFNLNKVCFIVCNKDSATTESNYLLNALVYDIVNHVSLYTLHATSIREYLFTGGSVDQLVTIPETSKSYLEKCWKQVTASVKDNKPPVKQKWYKKKPFRYLIEPIAWLFILFPF